MATSTPDISPADRLRILIVSDAADMEPSPAAGSMWRLAESLSHLHDVIIAFPSRTRAQHADFAVIYYNHRNIALLARDSDAVILTAAVRQANPSLDGLGRIAATTAARLHQGDFSGWPPGETGSSEAGPGNDEPGAELLVLRPDPPPTSTGLAHYLRRLGYHLHHGGIRRVASRSGALIKRRIRKQS